MIRRPPWQPDWHSLMAEAPEIELPAGGPVYVIADSHLGDAPPEPFLNTLERLHGAGTLLMLGDLFRVWLALPRFAGATVQRVLQGMARLRESGTTIVFAVGNREYFVPASPEDLRRSGLPFDYAIPAMAYLRWRGRRFGVTHGDIVNREDRQYLQWRRVSRGRLMGAVFRAMPPLLARALASRLEATLAHTNREIKISYPETEVRAFAETVTAGCDRFLIGHFHRDETVTAQNGGVLRIVPDWCSRQVLLRLNEAGAEDILTPEDL